MNFTVKSRSRSSTIGGCATDVLVAARSGCARGLSLCAGVGLSPRQNVIYSFVVRKRDIAEKYEYESLIFFRLIVIALLLAALYRVIFNSSKLSGRQLPYIIFYNFCYTTFYKTSNRTSVVGYKIGRLPARDLS